MMKLNLKLIKEYIINKYLVLIANTEEITI